MFDKKTCGFIEIVIYVLKQKPKNVTTFFPSPTLAFFGNNIDSHCWIFIFFPLLWIKVQTATVQATCAVIQPQTHSL